MDEFDSDTTPYSESPESPNEQHVEGSSRRKFLKAAVVGSAAAVAVSGVGAATLSLTGHHTGLRKFLVLGDTLSTVTSDACVTTSGDVSQNCYKDDTVFFWAKFNGVPASGAGFYTIDVTLPTSVIDFPSGSGNWVQVIAYPSGASFTCNPSSIPGSTANYVAQQDTLPVTFQTSSDGDVLLWLHLKPKATTSTSVMLSATLYHGSTTSSPVVDTTNVVTFTVGDGSCPS